jgi:hypothetical integral membrane protein (TIGR02206 family)
VNLLFKYFWTYYVDLPPGLGTPQFGAIHLAWLACIFAAVPLLVLLYRHLRPAARRRMQIILAILLGGGDLSVLIWITLVGHFSLAELLPLHLCSAMVWLESATVFARKNQLLREFAYCCGMPGALAALLTPTWLIYPFGNYQYIESIWAHTILILLPAIWIWGDGFRPSLRRLPACFGLLAGLAVVSALTNHLIGSNFMFLSYPPAGSILAVFAQWLGNPGYLAGLVGLVLVIWIVLYTPWLIHARRAKHRAGAGQPADPAAPRPAD